MNLIQNYAQEVGSLTNKLVEDLKVAHVTEAEAHQNEAPVVGSSETPIQDLIVGFAPTGLMKLNTA